MTFNDFGSFADFAIICSRPNGVVHRDISHRYNGGRQISPDCLIATIKSGILAIARDELEEVKIQGESRAAASAGTPSTSSTGSSSEALISSRDTVLDMQAQV